jgi:DNA polymerase I
MSKAKPKLMIIDGNALIHRSFHALPPTMATKDGEMVNAVYGFTSVLLKAIKDIKPEYVVLTLDMAGPTFRHAAYKEYKATRVKAPDDLYAQIPRVEEVAKTFGIPVFKLSGHEADDLIGTIAATVDGQVEKIILTGDMDTLQLVNHHTKVYTLSRGLSDSVIYDEQAVYDRYGLKPEQMVDYKALRGDPSDNIPGVKGVGDKTAVELLQNFKTLDGVYKEVEKVRSKKLEVRSEEKIKERIVELLWEHREEAEMSRSLATIDTRAPIEFDLSKARFGEFDMARAVELFSELEFKSLLPRLQALQAKNGKSPAVSHQDEGGKTFSEFADKFERNEKMFKYILVDDEKSFEKFFKKLKTQKEFVIDTETESLDPLDNRLLGISFSWAEGEAHYVNIRSKKLEVRSKFEKKQNSLFEYNVSTCHSRESGNPGVSAPIVDSRLRGNDKRKNGNDKREDWLEKLRPILEDDEVKKIGHNVKFDIRVLKAAGINMAGVEFDTMIASYLLNPGTRQHNLDILTFTELGFEKISKKELLGKDKGNFVGLELRKLYLYSCEDADFTYRLFKKLKPELKKQKLSGLLDNIEMPLVMALVNMEEAGIKLDSKFLQKMSKEIEKRIEKLAGQIHKEAGSEFNINSTQQLREILFEKLEISSRDISKGKTGLSTAALELEKLKNEHPIIRLIQEHRELNKLANTYIDTLPLLVNKKTGRLHTSFNQTVAATGRLSSSDPNLQNIPIRTDIGREIRKAFVADIGYKLLSLDYSQIELRLAAHMSGDPIMIKAFKDGEDIHSTTAATINEVKIEDVTKEMRREAKAINFGLLYGQGPHGLSQTADIPYARAREFIEHYFHSFNGVKEYIDKSIETAHKVGYIETLFGRRRFLPEINSSVMQVRKGAERMAVNTPIQGTAADMIKVAMIKIVKLINENYKSGEIRMLLQVHDELVFEVRDDIVETDGIRLIKDIMENVIKLKVPVVVDIKVGENWGEMGEAKS